MNRRNFLRGLGLLVGSALIPDEILPVTDFIEKKVEKPNLIVAKARRRGMSNTYTEATEQDFMDLMKDLEKRSLNPNQWVFITGEQGYKSFEFELQKAARNYR